MTAPGAVTRQVSLARPLSLSLSRSRSLSVSPTLTFAHFAMIGRLGGIPVVSLAAVVTIPSGRIVLTVVTNSAGHASRQLVQFQIEAAATSVSIALAH